MGGAETGMDRQACHTLRSIQMAGERSSFIGAIVSSFGFSNKSQLP